MQNNDNFKHIIASKFEKLWCEKELEDKRKIRYYNKVINPNLEYQNYLFVLTSVKNKINIDCSSFPPNLVIFIFFQLI